MRNNYLDIVVQVILKVIPSGSLDLPFCKSKMKYPTLKVSDILSSAATSSFSQSVEIYLSPFDCTSHKRMSFRENTHGF